MVLFLCGLMLANVNVMFADNSCEQHLDSFTPSIDIGDVWTHNYCRCRESSCTGGNAISFRRSCAKSSEPINCSSYSGNCN